MSIHAFRASSARHRRPDSYRGLPPLRGFLNSVETMNATAEPMRSTDWPEKATAAGGTSPTGVGRQAFREAMSRIASSVHIVTTDGFAGRCGFTATAFTSVSDDPPTVLVCLNRSSPQNPVFKANGTFGVNTLAAADRPLADVFAGRTGLHMAERFRHGDWRPLAGGAPALASARVALDCRLTSYVEAATHTILFGLVTDVVFGDPNPSLLYVCRDYRTL